MEKEKNNYFTDLISVNVSEHVEQKNGLNYLSWAWAWAEVCKRYPSATYEVVKFNGLPYVFDPETGYIVYTRVTLEGITREMWLPVMDGNNKAMKNKPYEITTRYGKKIPVEAATMFDINKSIMRCLTKNLGMFGLGLSLYAGEDIGADDKTIEPEPETKPVKAKTPAKKTPSAIRGAFVKYCKENGIEGEELITICKMFKLNNDSPDELFSNALIYCKDIVDRRNYAQNLAAEAGYPEEV
jgi:hypothetical protein